MTSYRVGNKTLLSWKLCIPDKNYYVTLLRGQGHYFRIRHERVRAAPSGVGLTFTSYPVGNATSLSRYIADKKLL